MRKSEIFENFIKIAEELDSKDSKDTQKKLENNPRMSGLSADDITKLYNLKLDIPDSMKYKSNIVEDAHPEPMVYSPAHDKVNGLFENVNERHNIIRNIMEKDPTGQLSHKKLAEKNLILNLVRLGNDLDNRGYSQLQVLADTCLMQKTTITKQAALPIALWMVPSLLGALYLQQNTDLINQGLKNNYNSLIKELDDILEANTNFGIGKQYSQNFINLIKDFKSKLTEFYNFYLELEGVINTFEKPRTGKELLELSQSANMNDVVEKYSKLEQIVANLVPYFEKIKQNFSSEEYKSRQIEEKGLFNKLLDKIPGKDYIDNIVSDDINDIVRALNPFIKSLEHVVNVVKQATKIKEHAKQELTQASMKSDKILNQEVETSDDTKKDFDISQWFQ